MILDLVQTIAILNLQKQNNKDSTNNISIFEYFFYFIICAVVLPLIIPAIILYLIFYCFNSGYNELKSNKSEFIDNKTFLKLLIPITIIIAGSVIAIIKFFH